MLNMTGEKQMPYPEKSQANSPDRADEAHNYIGPGRTGTAAAGAGMLCNGRPSAFAGLLGHDWRW